MKKMSAVLVGLVLVASVWGVAADRASAGRFEAAGASVGGVTFIQTGVVTFFNVAKGYGFIKADKDGSSIYVHVTGLSGGYKPKAGDRVEFEIAIVKDKRNAVMVRKARD